MAVRVLPGFRPALGFTIAYLSLLVLIPLSGVFIKSAGLSWGQYWHTVWLMR
jgi:sulfate transport system permease protein